MVPSSLEDVRVLKLPVPGKHPTTLNPTPSKLPAVRCGLAQGFYTCLGVYPRYDL